MNVIDSLLLFKLVVIGGFALWATLGIINNVVAFASGVAAVGRTMSMQLFDQEPAVKTPLLARRVTSESWHRLGFVALMVFQVVVCALLWYAVAGFVGALTGAGAASDAMARANLGLASLAAMVFFLTLGGQWFAYYIRQEGLNTVHYVLIALAMLAVLVVNVPGQ